jgi:hypothetical protein
MKLTKQRASAIRKVIDQNHHIADRTKILSKRGYQLISCSLKYGRSPVGKIHEYKHSCRLQVGSPKGYLRYSWMVMFEPASSMKIRELNDIYFSGVPV